MLRAFDYGLLAALGVALAYGFLWSVVALTWGLVAVGIAGGWLIGAAIRRGVQESRRRAQPPTDAAADESPYQPWPRGTSTLGALLGLVSWFVGSYVAFTIVQLVEGVGPLLERLSPANFAAVLAAVDPPLLPAIVAAFVLVGMLAAREPRPPSPRDKARR